MIATMAMNMPDLDDACRTTLIVVPAALLQQVNCYSMVINDGDRLNPLYSGKTR